MPAHAAIEYDATSHVEHVTLSPILLRPSSVAILLDVSRSMVYNLLAAGELTAMPVGRSRRIALSSVEDYVARHLPPAGEPHGEARP